jgi:hypothetical protein
MAFYVAVGPRGLLFRVGMLLTGVMGPWTYWRASRRRPAALPPWSSPEVSVTVRGRHDLPADRSPADLVGMGS